jgi:hypothetical protein
MGPDLDYYVDAVAQTRQVISKGSILGLLKSSGFEASYLGYKIRRGFGSAFTVLDNKVPVPLEWYNGELPPQPVGTAFHPNILSCKAFLVRDVNNNIKIIVASYAHMQCPGNMPLPLRGAISPAGHGQGFASIDVFDLEGNPVHTGTPFNAPTALVLTTLPKPPPV